MAAPAEWPAARAGHDLKLRQKRAKRLGRARQRRRIQRAGKTMAGQVHGDDLEVFSQPRREIAEGMGGGRRAVHQQQGRARSQTLDMPDQPAGGDLSAGLAMGPVGGDGSRAHAAASRARSASAAAPPARGRRT